MALAPALTPVSAQKVPSPTTLAPVMLAQRPGSARRPPKALPPTPVSAFPSISNRPTSLMCSG